jgi:hypothetical protein
MTHRECLIRVDDQMLDDTSYARSSRGVYNSNLLCDHQGILLRYMGMSEDLWLPVKLQHGWGTKTHGEFFDRIHLKTSNAPILVWGDRFYEDLLKYDMESKKVGAPILYKNIDVSWIDPDRNSAIFFPVHGVDDIHVTNFSELDRLKQDLSVDRVTICLHPHDYTNEIITMMKGFGYDCTTAGGIMRQGFLWRCLALIASHGFVAANSVSTVSFYAGLANRPFVVAGPLPTYNVEWPVSSREWTAKEFPEFMTLSDFAHKEVTARELGLAYVRSPAQLREIILSTSNEWNEGEQEYALLWRR